MSTKEVTNEYLEQFLDDQSVEELSQETGKGEYKDPTVIKFSREFQLQSGDIRVPSYIIYMVYRTLFTRVSNSVKIKPTAFFRSFKKLFTQVRSGSQRFYMLNTDFDLQPEVWERFERDYKRYYMKDK